MCTVDEADVVQKQWKRRRVIFKRTDERMRKRTIERAGRDACPLYRVDDAHDLYIRDWGTTFTDNPRAPISLSNHTNSAFGVCWARYHRALNRVGPLVWYIRTHRPFYIPRFRLVVLYTNYWFEWRSSLTGLWIFTIDLPIPTITLYKIVLHAKSIERWGCKIEMRVKIIYWKWYTSVKPGFRRNF